MTDLFGFFWLDLAALPRDWGERSGVACARAWGGWAAVDSGDAEPSLQSLNRTFKVGTNCYEHPDRAGRPPWVVGSNWRRSIPSPDRLGIFSGF